MLCDLNKLFPEPQYGGKRGPLPRQADFLRSVFAPGDPKYVLYAGGVGSGKSLIGCISVISLAVQYPGDYMIARQFLPELKLTTYKAFLDLCPKELILEHRVADGIVRLRSSGGKSSSVIFRGLDEPDKHRSLNLNAAYIDESSQVSEQAFIILQSRLRGPHVRKILMTTNVSGHDWQHSRFIKQDGMSEAAKKQFKLIQAPSTENIHLPPGYVESMMLTYSQDRIEREIKANWDSFAGQVYSEFRRDIHVIPPFQIPSDWHRIAGVDHGFRNPAAWVWGAVDYDENIYIYREFYEKEWLISQIAKGHEKLNKPGVLALMGKERLREAHIDPSVRARRGTGLSDWDAYLENFPESFPFKLANNDKTAGIDRVKSYLKIDPRTGKPRLFIFNTCVNLIEEFTKYRYGELRPSQVGNKSEKEEPVKVNDHSLDATRYLLMSRPEAPKLSVIEWTKKVPYASPSGHLIRDLESKKRPKDKGDPFGL